MRIFIFVEEAALALGRKRPASSAHTEQEEEMDDINVGYDNHFVDFL